MDEGTNRKIAVLIDAENISYKYAKLALDEAARFGTVICKRIYADWSSSVTTSWRKVVQDYSIHPIQQFSTVAGKNASDSAMITERTFYEMGMARREIEQNATGRTITLEDGTPVYITSNYELLAASWIKGNVQCTLYGSIDESDFEKCLDSIEFEKEI